MVKKVLYSYYSDTIVDNCILKRFEVVRDIETKEIEVVCMYISGNQTFSEVLPLKDFSEKWNINFSNLLTVLE
jgi:hypothetical protein